MLSEAHYRTVLNFFYFLLLDEGLALNASYKAIKKANRELQKKTPRKIDVILIRALCDVLKQSLSQKKQAVSTPPQSDWKMAKPQNALIWKEYLRRGDPDSNSVLILHYVLGYGADVISEALELPEGTVLFRLGRGLEALAATPALVQAGGRRS